MDELDLDGSGEVGKQEFIDAYIMKHQALVDEKYNIQEEIKDLETKFIMLEEREDRQHFQGVRRERLQNIYKVVVVEARNLAVADIMTGTSDPYVVLSYLGQVSKTTIKKTNLNPIWKESFEFDVARGGKSVLEVTVYDYDALSKDDIVGIVDIDMSQFPPNGVPHDMWFSITDEDKEKSGDLRLIIQHISHGVHDYKQEKQQISDQLDAKEIELQAVEDMLEMTEKPFALFDIEKREKAMEQDVAGTLAPRSGERRISDRLHKLTEKAPWVTILLFFMFIYTFLTVICCFYRPDFLD